MIRDLCDVERKRILHKFFFYRSFNVHLPALYWMPESVHGYVPASFMMLNVHAPDSDPYHNTKYTSRLDDFCSILAVPEGTNLYSIYMS